MGPGTSNLFLGYLEKGTFPCMKIEGLQYGFGELYSRTKPRVVRNDGYLLKRPINLIEFNYLLNVFFRFLNDLCFLNSFS